jgi:hypothetical protein
VRRRGRIIIRRNGAKTISLQTSFGDLIRNGAKTISHQTSLGDLIIIIILIIITRFYCVWMQSQKSPNDPHIRIQGTNQLLTSKYS